MVCSRLLRVVPERSSGSLINVLTTCVPKGHNRSIVERGGRVLHDRHVTSMRVLLSLRSGYESKQEGLSARPGRATLIVGGG